MVSQGKHLGKCPVCEGELHVTGLVCHTCDTTIQGAFLRCRFCNLSEDERSFIATFIDCRGNIKEVERELNISYPTVRNRLEQVRSSLGFSPLRQGEVAKTRREIIQSLSAGDIDAGEAIKSLEQLRNSTK